MATRWPRAMNRQSGLSLLEMMIALSLGLLLAMGIGTLFVGSNQTNRVQDDNARIQEAGRFALEIIGRSVRRAGYTAISVLPNNTHVSFVGTPINGTNGAGAAADTITLQYDGEVGDSDCEGTKVTAAMIPIVVQDAFQLDAAKFQLECDGNLDGTVDFQPLVGSPADASGNSTGPQVEDLQIIYGIDTDGDQSANQYTATPVDWTKVVTARVCVLIRSGDQGVAAGQQSYLNCAGALGTASGAAASTTAADSRLHRAFVATYNLRNRISLIP